MKSILKILSVFILFISITSCDNEPFGGIFVNGEVINVDSELYNLLERIADEGEELEPITCIEFVYPLTIYIFDENLEYSNTQYITTDQQFSDLLGSLDITYSISVSYPITSTLNDGSTFVIETNEQLKEAIDNCIRDEAIGNCQELIRNCIWKVIYLEDSENTYVGGIFQENDGATTFNFDGNILFGSWSPLFIEDELHLNIHLNSTNEVADFWNNDWLVTYLGSSAMRLSTENHSVLLTQICDNNDSCTNTGLNYNECELTNNSGHAEFIFDNYKTCILTLFLVEGITDAENLNVTFHETYDDSETNSNAILSSQAYINLEQDQVIWVRIENLDSLEYIIIPITINAISC